MKTLHRTLTALLLAAASAAPSATAQCVGGERVEPPSPSPDGGYGAGVGVSGDWLLAGARNDGAGSVSVFQRQGTSWVYDSTLTASDGVAGDAFGARIEVDGDFAIIGAPLADSNGAEGGKAYVFKRGAFGWTENAILSAPGTLPGDRFGFDVALDGDVAVVGAPYAGTIVPFDGAAYVFQRDRGAWQYAQKLTSQTAVGESYRFGWSVATSQGRIAVGMPTIDVQIFTPSADSWDFTAVLPNNCCQFAASIAMDGDFLVAGAPADSVNANQDGSANVYRFDGAIWQFLQTLSPSPSSAFDHFGAQVDVQDQVVVIGSPGYEGFDGQSAGATYAYRLNGGRFQNVQVLYAEGAGEGDLFGSAVATSQGLVVQGGPQALDASGTSTTGAVFSFDLSELNLSTSLPDPGPGDVFELVAGCGPSGTPVALFVMDVGGNPFRQLLFVGAFDSSSVLRLPVNGAPDLGVDVTLQAFGFNIQSRLVESNPLTLSL